MKVKSVLIWGIVGSVVLFFTLGLRNARETQPVPGNQAPQIDLQFYDGYAWDDLDEATLSDLQGQVVVLNFWRSSCIPCQDEADELEAVWREYQDHDVIFLGIAWSDTDKKALEFLKAHNISYPNAPDIGLEAQESYHFRSVPETFVLKKDGTIAYFHAGPVTKQTLRQYIESALSSS